MNRLNHDFYALVLMAYGFAATCFNRDGTTEHREVSVEVNGDLHQYKCWCGKRVPYTEIWRDS